MVMTGHTIICFRSNKSDLNLNLGPDRREACVPAQYVADPASFLDAIAQANQN